MADSKGLSLETVDELRTQFLQDEKNLVALNMGVKHGPVELLLNRTEGEKVRHIFNHKIPDVKPVTHQRNSGRCWIFAILNVIRQQIAPYFSVEELEFSQSYLFFHDKIERCFYFLNVFVELAKKGEDIDGRLFMFLLHNPMEDGGQWSMLVNLIEKYGIMPKAVYTDAFSSTNSRHMNYILNQKLREYCLTLKDMATSGDSGKAEIDTEIQRMMSEIYRVCAICLGVPPKEFDWEYYDKDNRYVCVKNVTPQEFYQKQVKRIYNLEDKVVLVNDPRPCNSYGKLYTVDYLNNMHGGRPVLYINQPIEVLKSAAAKSISTNEGVWFGCDVGKHFIEKKGALNLNLHGYDLVFGFSMLNLTKAQRLLAGCSMMTHAMVFTGMQVENPEDERQAGENERSETTVVTRWRVENSWGEESGEKGYVVMTNEWFDEFLYEVVVDKCHLSKEILEILNQEPIHLPAWDPMGALAH